MNTHIGAINLPKEQIYEAAEEYGRMINEIRALRHAWQRYQRTGIVRDRAALARDAREMRGRARYAVRAWVNQGAWPGYYRVPSGLVHNCIGCRTITDHTALVALPVLSGMTMTEVILRGYKVCGHCRNRPYEKTVWRVRQFVERVCVAMDEIVDTLGTD